MQSHDLVIYGASSFVGKIICHYLADYCTQTESFSWALAGRSKRKLEAVRAELPEHCQELPIIIAEADDENALVPMCESTKVVLSTVGPYALYGELLVKICASLGTDYCDLTGEAHWIAKMLDRYEAAAKASRARIVHCCGFDSVPFDLGVYFLQQHAKNKTGKPCQTVKTNVIGMRGGASGGTIASIINLVKEATTSKQTRKILLNPYALCPKNHEFHIRQFEQKTAMYDADIKAWTAPFIMAAINTRVVHRSNALLDNGYSKDFNYREALKVGSRFKANVTSFGLSGFTGLAAIPTSRWFLEKFILPNPGEGPSEEEQENGFYKIRIMGKNETEEAIAVEVIGDKDPGYGSTAKIIAQAALCLLFETPKQDYNGGFWTPASIFGEKLIDRLQQHSGVTFKLLY